MEVEKGELVNMEVNKKNVGGSHIASAPLVGSSVSPSTAACADKYADGGMFVEVVGVQGWCGDTVGNWEMELEDCGGIERVDYKFDVDGQLVSPVSVYEVEAVEVGKKIK